MNRYLLHSVIVFSLIIQAYFYYSLQEIHDTLNDISLWMKEREMSLSKLETKPIQSNLEPLPVSTNSISTSKDNSKISFLIDKIHNLEGQILNKDEIHEEQSSLIINTDGFISNASFQVGRNLQAGTGKNITDMEKNFNQEAGKSDWGYNIETTLTSQFNETPFFYENGGTIDVTCRQNICAVKWVSTDLVDISDEEKNEILTMAEFELLGVVANNSGVNQLEVMTSIQNGNSEVMLRFDRKNSDSF